MSTCDFIRNRKIKIVLSYKCEEHISDSVLSIMLCSLN